MIKRIIFSLGLIVFATNIFASISAIDTSYTDGITAFEWSPISDVDKILQYENQKDISKRTIDQAKKAEEHYVAAFNLMENKEYDAALIEFKAAMKRYKRAKLTPDALNYIHANMALSYAKTGNKEDLAVASRYLNLITSKAFTDDNWTYNIAMGHYFSGNQNEAASLLSALIRKAEFNFQAYITLEALYRNSGNDDDADRVNDRMQTAIEKLDKKNKKTKSKGGEVAKTNNTKRAVVPRGKKADVTNLQIIKKDDHLQFDKVSKIDERSMIQIQEGIGEYNLGTKALANKEYKAAQKNLKNAEKRLKRGKISEDGLNFSRANLAISYLALQDKRGLGQAKRYLKAITSKIYSNQKWTYNLAVAYADFSARSARKNRDGSVKHTTASSLNLKEAIKLFKKSIKQEKLFLPAYENLIYIYKTEGEDKKALSVYKSYLKARDNLMRSFSKEDQIAQGGAPYIFRLNLGTFGDFDTPASLFNEEHVITIPIDERKTAYLAGLFYSLDEAEEFQEEMKRKGYTNSFIVAYKDGEKLEF